jgi:hypothetical protein
MIDTAVRIANAAICIGCFVIIRRWGLGDFPSAIISIAIGALLGFLYATFEGRNAPHEDK